MKYVVTIGEERHEVELDGEGVHVDGALVPARLADVPGTPVRLVTIGDADVPRHQLADFQAGIRKRYTDVTAVA